MDIAITLAAGRPRVIPVLENFLNNAESYKHNLKDFSIYISVDTDFMNESLDSFKIPDNIKSKLKHIELISKEDRKAIGSKLQKEKNIPSNIAEILFCEKGYSPLRNSALYRALEDNNDIAVFFDDDELPIIPLRDSDYNLHWKNLDFFTPHIDAIKKGAEITRGPYMGYLSPIPSDFDRNIPKEIRQALGKALAHGNDVINANTFMDIMNSQIRFLNPEKITNKPTAFEVESDSYGKHIYAGNMAFNLNSVRAGKIPIFYTPPNARGEDTIFALQLENVIVKEVNSYIFHDPFNMYPELLEGKTPESLAPIPVSEESINRFASALAGWIKYAPILIKMTSNTKEEERQRIENMLYDIQSPAKQLAKVLNKPEINSSHKLLKKYSNMADSNYSTLKEVQDVWKNKILKKENQYSTH